jgi:hypothetical protein
VSLGRPVVNRFAEKFRSAASEWAPTSTGFVSGPMDRAALPADYLQLIEAIGPGEGFVGARYLRLYPLEELTAANVAYAVPVYLPGYQIFGSDGCGVAFLFELATRSGQVIEQPFIPLDPEYTAARHPSFWAFLEQFTAVPVGVPPPIANPRTRGLEVHERHPVVLGGDPTDPANKVLLPPTTHAEACTFFNHVFQRVRAQSRT